MRPTTFRMFVVVLLAVASLGVAASGVWAAGDLAACSLVASESTRPDPLGTILEAVAVSDGGDVWTVGSHVVGPISSPIVQRWNGSTWTQQKLDLPQGPIGLSSLYDVKAFGPDDVWAVGSWMGEDPLIQHWDGSAWSAVEAPKLDGTEGILTGIDGTGPNDLWIVGQHRVDQQEHGVVLHGGIAGFQIVPPPDAAVLHDVAIEPGGAPLVAGWSIGDTGFADAVLASLQGGSWRSLPTPEKEDTNVFLFGLAVNDRGDAWAVGFSNTSPNGDTPVTLRRGSNAWTEIREPDLGASTRIVSVATDDAGTVAVGVVSENGTSRAVAIRLDGDMWTPIPGAGSQPPDALGGVALDGSDIWAVGRAVVVGATYGVPSARVYSCG
jgi:hypothetical protein